MTDPWSELDHPNDTSMRLAQAALRLGYRVSWCDGRSIRFDRGRIVLDSWKIAEIGENRAEDAFELLPEGPCEPGSYGRILYRTDPPVDLAWIQPLQLLSLGIRLSRSRTQLINPADALMLANEKLEPALLGELMPPSCVSSQLPALERFGRLEGLTVVKPLHQAQSKGVELLDWRTKASSDACLAKLRQMTEGEKRPVLLQRYLSGIARGEQRLWFLNGKLLAHARKLPRQGEFRIDMDRGGTLVASELTRGERKAASRIGSALRSRGIRLAAVDLIDEKVTDYNITSPGLIVQMEAVTGRDLASQIIKGL